MLTNMPLGAGVVAVCPPRPCAIARTARGAAAIVARSSLRFRGSMNTFLLGGVGGPEGSKATAEAPKPRRRRTETIPRVGPTLKAENIVHSGILEEKTHETTDHCFPDFARLCDGVFAEAGSQRTEPAHHAGRARAQLFVRSERPELPRGHSYAPPGRSGIRLERTSVGGQPAGKWDQYADGCRVRRKRKVSALFR